jgi:hypothetical protein
VALTGAALSITLFFVHVLHPFLLFTAHQPQQLKQLAVVQCMLRELHVP